MERKIKTYGGYFEKFMETLTDKEQDKVQYALLLLKTQNKVSVKFVFKRKHRKRRRMKLM
jgi:hypothetical protein